MLEPTTKRCPSCGETKTLDYYTKNKNGKLGVNCYCRNCYKKYSDRKPAYQQKYYQENKVKIAEYHQKHRLEPAVRDETKDRNK